jgi:hypothetical protein
MALEMQLKVGFCQRITVTQPPHGFPAQFRAGISTFLFHNGGWMVGWAHYGRAEVGSNICMHGSPPPKPMARTDFFPHCR